MENVNEHLNENVTENINKRSNENINIKCFGRYIYKNLSIIAVVLSITSILFSIFALVSVNKHPVRDFRMERPYDIQASAPDGYFNGNDFAGPNDNQFFGQKPQMRRHTLRGNKFYGGRQNNNQNGKKRFNNDSRFDKPNNEIKNNNNSNPTAPSTSDSGPKVAPEISPSK